MASNIEPREQFEGRKKDHIRLSLSPKNQAVGEAGFDLVELVHEALPDLNFEQVNLACDALGQKTKTPFLISSMTAGHAEAVDLNARLARAAHERGWRMGVGSQRKELGDAAAAEEWRVIRKLAPRVLLYGNLGLAQLIRTKISAVEKLVDSLEAGAMIIHLNSLQECLQPEGTPAYKGGVKALTELSKKLSVPVIVKETGCGFSKKTLKRLRGISLGAVDISGYGGTHWGRIEGDRNERGSMRGQAAATFANWGISTVESLAEAAAMKTDYEVWASGGVRSGLDAAKLLAMGARVVGLAQPVLEAALKGESELHARMELLEFELKTAMFCTGSAGLKELREEKVWKWKR